MKYITENILLGTDRRKLEKSNLPVDLQIYVNQDSTDEEQLLDALTYGYFYGEQGKLVEEIQLDREPIVIVEKKEELSELSHELLEDILSQSKLLRLELLKSFIFEVRQKKLIVKGKYILQLIEESKRFSQDYRKLTLKIIGRKGKHILQSFPVKEYEGLVGKAKEDSLSSLNMIENFISESHAFRNAFLQDNWKQLSIHEKINFTKLVCKDLSKRYLKFYEEIFYKDFAEVYSDKAFTRELKRLIVYILLKLGEPDLTNELSDRLSFNIEETRGFFKKLMSSQSRFLVIPYKADSFWNGKSLNAFLGLEEQSSNIALFDYDNYFLFSSMLEIVPFSLIADVMECNYNKAFDYLCSDEQFTKDFSGVEVSILEGALIENASLSRDQELISLLAKKFKGPDMDLLIPLMEQSTFERFFLRNRSVTKLDLLATRSMTPENQWSLSFSKNMISELLKICKSGTFYPHEKYGITIARFIHKDAYDHLITVSASFSNESWFETWKTKIVLVVQQSLKIRQALHQISA
ncbi:hypothetical protein N9B82_06170 [Saprospiraceae bacterium]|nr:hypothetical protein [Saprospiraceae bacterium]